MPRRLAPLLAALATFALVACQAAPAAPALTDPKEILAQSVTSLQNVKTLQVNGTFGGSLVAEGMGNFDLSTVKLDVAADIPGKKSKVTLDAPSLLGTNVELITLEDAIYVKVLGALAGMTGMDTTGKYTRMPVDSGIVPEDATDPVKALEEVRKALDELPKAPEKLADERCGDVDCYHVQIAMTADELAELSPDAAGQLGSMSFDIWSRKNDLRPARMAFAVDAGEQGNVTGTFDITYDGNVDISAPPADQVVEAP